MEGVMSLALDPLAAAMADAAAMSHIESRIRSLFVECGRLRDNNRELAASLEAAIARVDCMTVGELDALMRKHRVWVEYGSDPTRRAFRAVACDGHTWDPDGVTLTVRVVAECCAPSLLESIAGLVAHLEGRS